MAFNFPGNPSEGQTYTLGGMVYVWHQYAWMSRGTEAAGAKMPGFPGKKTDEDSEQIESTEETE